MSAAYLLGGCRTPIGRFLGGLASIPAPRLAAVAIAAALERSGVEPSAIDEVLLGNVVGAGLGQAPARQAALHAGLPAAVAATTINKVCGSGLAAILLADRAIRCGDARAIVVGGMESMSGAPHLLSGARTGWKFAPQTVVDALAHDGLCCAFENVSMGALADRTARRHGISRAEQDIYAAVSHQRALAAIEAGLSQVEIAPVAVAGKNGPQSIDRDEGPRADASVEKLAALAPAFSPDGTATAGNSSSLSDGAAAVVVVDEALARGVDSPFKARIVATAVAAGAPADVFLAPVAAIDRVLAKARLQLSDIDLVELNEAFASQTLACLRALRLEASRVNIAGGAIALGHPLGASGARIVVTLLHSLAALDLRRGLAALCLGGGEAVAIIVERA